MIFGEPTNNELLVGSKGLLEYELLFKGIKAHSSNPEKGVSANMNAVKFLAELDEFYNKDIKPYKELSYEIPYTTMNVGIINGGIEKNSVSAFCKATLDFRPANKNHINIIQEKVEELSQKYNCELKIIEKVEPFLNKTELVSTIKTSNFITEASLVDTPNRIILGPGPVIPHEVNEHITTESYNKLVEQYKDLIKKVCE